jgi:hypothetical protein
MCRSNRYRLTVESSRNSHFCPVMETPGWGLSPNTLQTLQLVVQPVRRSKDAATADAMSHIVSGVGESLLAAGAQCRARSHVAHAMLGPPHQWKVAPTRTKWRRRAALLLWPSVPRTRRRSIIIVSVEGQEIELVHPLLLCFHPPTGYCSAAVHVTMEMFAVATF